MIKTIVFIALLGIVWSKFHSHNKDKNYHNHNNTDSHHHRNDYKKIIIDIIKFENGENTKNITKNKSFRNVDHLMNKPILRNLLRDCLEDAKKLCFPILNNLTSHEEDEDHHDDEKEINIYSTTQRQLRLNRRKSRKSTPKLRKLISSEKENDSHDHHHHLKGFRLPRLLCSCLWKHQSNVSMSCLEQLKHQKERFDHKQIKFYHGKHGV